MNNVNEYDSWNQLTKTMQGGKTTSYTYNGDGLRMSKNVGGTTTSHIWDGTNIAADVTGGTVTKQYSYDAFGNEMNKVDSDTNPFRYCGEYYDKENDSIYLRARYYKPNTGRFINEDPVKDGLNWYAYCGNEPVMLVDPSGLKLKSEGRAEEQQIVIDYLRVLTRDSLDIDSDGFVQNYRICQIIGKSVFLLW